MILLGIETSCDETSAAVVKDGRHVLSNVIASQIEIHQKYGGVVPEIASRKHVEAIGCIVEEALFEADIKKEQIDGICVTYGPGLVGALLVGLSYGKALSFALKKPLIGVHHIEAHICANYLETEGEEPIKPPYICLVVSGGHTSLVLCQEYGKYKLLGQTKDDACGEAYDKVARALGLPYPGGPIIDKIAKEGDEKAIVFPQALINDGSFDFSFSGLKSAVLNTLNKAKMQGIELNKSDVAASFQKALIDVLEAKTKLACQKYNINRVALAGGVSSNSALRSRISNMCQKNGYTFKVPPTYFCTDNAAMVCACGYIMFEKGHRDGLFLNAVPNCPINID